MKTGCIDLDNLTEYKENSITLIYGAGGSGKTTLGLLVSINALKEKKKVLFIDAGNNFSVERFNQLSNDPSLLPKMLIMKIKSFNVQHEHIKKLSELKGFDLIVIDSLTTFYRRLYSREPELAMAMLNKQLGILDDLTKNNITIVITSEVYSDMEKNIHPVAEEILKRFTSLNIKLEKQPRRLIISKPEFKYFNFKIINEGIIKI